MKNQNKRTLVRLMLLAALILCLGAKEVLPVCAHPTPQSTPPTSEGVLQALAAEGTARIIVALELPKSADTIRSQQLGLAQLQVLGDILKKDFEVVHRYWSVPAIAGVVTPQGLAQLLDNPQVKAVALDMPVYPALAESTQVIRAAQARNTFDVNGAGVTIAVLDSGIDLGHPDLAKRVIAQHCFTHGACSPNNSDEGETAQDTYGHGTRVAGVIASQGTATPQGIAPGAAIVAVQVMDNLGQGWTSDVIAALDWVVTNQSRLGVKIINLSLGGGRYTTICDDTDAITLLYKDAINAARQAGITVFAASGNQAQSNAMVAPACISGAIAVGGTYDANIGTRNWSSCVDSETAVDKIACFSNNSPALDLLAPGATINTTSVGGGQAIDSGTSMAAPHAAAVAALMLHKNPDLTPDEIERILKETGVPIYDPRNGITTPRIDAFTAVEAVSGVTPPAVISGTVRLQGVSNYQGTTLLLSKDPCTSLYPDPLDTEVLSTTTNTEGHFELAPDPSHAYRCLYARHTHYLQGQRALPITTAGDTLTLPAGDIIEDNIINIFDLTRVASRYGSDDTIADINADGIVNIFDLTLVAGNYGKRGPITDWQ